MSTATARWPTATREHPCPRCGKLNRCRIAPDGTAGICWRSGTSETWNDHKHNGNGRYHKPDPTPAKPKQTYVTPDDAMQAAGQYIRGGSLRALYVYPGDVARVGRFDRPSGGKEFRPIHRTANGWAVGDPPEKWSLYRSDEIPADGTIFLVEGEKCADIARTIGLPAVASAHGSAAAAKTDWSKLAGRDVVILPDHDTPGQKYAQEATGILVALGCTVRIVALPHLPQGGDIEQFIHARPSKSPQAVAAEIIGLANAVAFINRVELMGGVVTRCLADVQAEDVAWLWPGRFALGKLSLIGGVPGVGKSWLSLFIAAAISRGMTWPDGRGNAPLGNVVIANAEDGAADTIKPRLNGMGADCGCIHVLDCIQRPGENGKIIERGFTLADAGFLEDAIKRIRPLAIVIDPVSAFLADADEHRNGEVRGLLKPLSRLAEKYGVAIILITHLTKNGGANSVHRMIGSIAFAGAARSVWMVAKDPKNLARRLLLLAKCNIAADAGGLAYSIVDGAIAWESDPVTESADEVLADEHGGDGPGRPPEERNAASEWLAGELADLSEHAVDDLRRDAQAAGLAWRTIQRAAAGMKVIRQRSSFGGGFMWRLPKPGTDTDSDAVPIRATIVPTSGTHKQSGTIGRIGTNGELAEKQDTHTLPTVSISLPCQKSVLARESGTDGESRERGEL